MPADDPGSLDRLHDIAVAPPVPWWPPAPGWYVLGAIASIILGYAVWQAVRNRNRNRYRRAALKLLGGLPNNPDSLAALAELLKRVALAAYPRDRVASLTGVPWLKFLDDSCEGDVFIAGPGQCLGDAAYRPRPDVDAKAAFAAARHWIRHHRC